MQFSTAAAFNTTAHKPAWPRGQAPQVEKLGCAVRGFFVLPTPAEAQPRVSRVSRASTRRWEGSNLEVTWRSELSPDSKVGRLVEKRILKI